MLVIAVCIVQANCRQWVVLCMHVALIATQKLAESSGSEDNSDVSAFCNDSAHASFCISQLSR